jgi:hypothetical protein
MPYRFITDLHLASVTSNNCLGLEFAPAIANRRTFHYSTIPLFQFIRFAAFRFSTQKSVYVWRSLPLTAPALSCLKGSKPQICNWPKHSLKTNARAPQLHPPTKFRNPSVLVIARDQDHAAADWVQNWLKVVFQTSFSETKNL